MANEGEFPKTDGDIFYASEANRLVRHVVSEQPDTSVTSSTTETMLGSVVVGAGSAYTGILILATGKVQHDMDLTVTTYISLYTGSDAAFGNNTMRRTIQRNFSDVTSNEQDNIQSGWAVNYWLTSGTAGPLYTGSDTYIQVTGSKTNADAGITITCESLTAIPL